LLHVFLKSSSFSTLKIKLGHFIFVANIHGDICKLRCTTGIHNTNGKFLKLFATGVVDTGGKFASRINDASCIPVVSLTPEENLPLVSATPAVNLPPVSTTPVAIIGTISYNKTQNKNVGSRAPHLDVQQ
jgi:hypothetical protein